LSFIDWTPLYRLETAPYGYACLSPVSYVRLLWARLTERRAEWPVKPKGTLVVPVSIGPQRVTLPNGHGCCLGTADKNFEPYWALAKTSD
jgi:hypothetical protein